MRVYKGTSYAAMAHHPTCVYRCFDAGGHLLYVGLSKNLLGRIAKHRRKPWWPLVDHIEEEWFDDREAAKAAEKLAIHHEGPLHNITRPRMECC